MGMSHKFIRENKKPILYVVVCPKGLNGVKDEIVYSIGAGGKKNKGQSSWIARNGTTPGQPLTNDWAIATDLAPETPIDLEYQPSSADHMLEDIRSTPAGDKTLETFKEYFMWADGAKGAFNSPVVHGVYTLYKEDIGTKIKSIIELPETATHYATAPSVVNAIIANNLDTIYDTYEELFTLIAELESVSLLKNQLDSFSPTGKWISKAQKGNPKVKGKVYQIIEYDNDKVFAHLNLIRSPKTIWDGSAAIYALDPEEGSEGEPTAADAATENEVRMDGINLYISLIYKTLGFQPLPDTPGGKTVTALMVWKLLTKGEKKYINFIKKYPNGKMFAYSFWQNVDSQKILSAGFPDNIHLSHPLVPGMGFESPAAAKEAGLILKDTFASSIGAGPDDVQVGAKSKLKGWGGTYCPNLDVQWTNQIKALKTKIKTKKGIIDTQKKKIKKDFKTTIPDFFEPGRVDIYASPVDTQGNKIGTIPAGMPLSIGSLYVGPELNFHRIYNDKLFMKSIATKKFGVTVSHDDDPIAMPNLYVKVSQTKPLGQAILGRSSKPRLPLAKPTATVKKTTTPNWINLDSCQPFYDSRINRYCITVEVDLSNTPEEIAAEIEAKASYNEAIKAAMSRVKAIDNDGMITSGDMPIDWKVKIKEVQESGFMMKGLPKGVFAELDISKGRGSYAAAMTVNWPDGTHQSSEEYPVTLPGHKGLESLASQGQVPDESFVSPATDEPGGFDLTPSLTLELESLPGAGIAGAMIGQLDNAVTKTYPDFESATAFKKWRSATLKLQELVGSGELAKIQLSGLTQLLQYHFKKLPPDVSIPGQPGRVALPEPILTAATAAGGIEGVKTMDGVVSLAIDSLSDAQTAMWLLDAGDRIVDPISADDIIYDERPDYNAVPTITTTTPDAGAQADVKLKTRTIVRAVVKVPAVYFDALSPKDPSLLMEVAQKNASRTTVINSKTFRKEIAIVVEILEKYSEDINQAAVAGPHHEIVPAIDLKKEAERLNSWVANLEVFLKQNGFALREDFEDKIEIGFYDIEGVTLTTFTPDPDDPNDETGYEDPITLAGHPFNISYILFHNDPKAVATGHKLPSVWGDEEDSETQTAIRAVDDGDNTLGPAPESETKVVKKAMVLGAPQLIQMTYGDPDSPESPAWSGTFCGIGLSCIHLNFGDSPTTNALAFYTYWMTHGLFTRKPLSEVPWTEFVRRYIRTVPPVTIRWMATPRPSAPRAPEKISKEERNAQTERLERMMNNKPYKTATQKKTEEELLNENVKKWITLSQKPVAELVFDDLAKDFERDVQGVPELDHLYKNLLNRTDITMLASQLASCLSLDMTLEELLVIACKFVLDKIGFEEFVEAFKKAGYSDYLFREPDGILHQMMNNSEGLADAINQVHTNKKNHESKRQAINLQRLDAKAATLESYIAANEAYLEYEQLQTLLKEMKASLSLPLLATAPDAMSEYELDQWSYTVAPQLQELKNLELDLENQRLIVKGLEAEERSNRAKEKKLKQNLKDHNLNTPLYANLNPGSDNLEYANQRFLDALKFLDDLAKKGLCQKMSIIFPKVGKLIAPYLNRKGLKNVEEAAEGAIKGEPTSEKKEEEKAKDAQEGAKNADEAMSNKASELPQIKTRIPETINMEDLNKWFYKKLEKFLIDLLTDLILDGIKWVLEELLAACQWLRDKLAGLFDEEEYVEQENLMDLINQASDYNNDNYNLAAAANILAKFGLNFDINTLPAMLEDISLVLLPTELCDMLQGNASSTTVRRVQNIIKAKYPHLAEQLRSRNKVIDLFVEFGKIVNLDFCELLNPLSAFLEHPAIDECDLINVEKTFRDQLGTNNLDPELVRLQLDSAKKRKSEQIRNLMGFMENPDIEIDFPCIGGAAVPLPASSQYSNEVAMDGMYRTVSLSFNGDVESFVPLMILSSRGVSVMDMQTTNTLQSLAGGTETSPESMLADMKVKKAKVLPELREKLIDRNSIYAKNAYIETGVAAAMTTIAFAPDGWMSGKKIILRLPHQSSDISAITKFVKGKWQLSLEDGISQVAYPQRDAMFTAPTFNETDIIGASYHGEGNPEYSPQAELFSQAIMAGLGFANSNIVSNNHIINFTAMIKKKLYQKTLKGVLLQIARDITNSKVFEEPTLRKLEGAFTPSVGMDIGDIVEDNCLLEGDLLQISKSPGLADQIMQELACITKDFSAITANIPGLQPVDKVFNLANMEVIIRLLIRLHVLEAILKNIFLFSEFNSKDIFDDKIFMEYLINLIPDTLDDDKDRMRLGSPPLSEQFFLHLQYAIERMRKLGYVFKDSLGNPIEIKDSADAVRYIAQGDFTDLNEKFEVPLRKVSANTYNSINEAFSKLIFSSDALEIYDTPIYSPIFYQTAITTHTAPGTDTPSQTETKSNAKTNHWVGGFLDDFVPTFDHALESRFAAPAGVPEVKANQKALEGIVSAVSEDRTNERMYGKFILERYVKISGELNDEKEIYWTDAAAKTVNKVPKYPHLLEKGHLLGSQGHAYQMFLECITRRARPSTSYSGLKKGDIQEWGLRSAHGPATVSFPSVTEGTKPSSVKDLSPYIPWGAKLSAKYFEETTELSPPGAASDTVKIRYTYSVPSKTHNYYGVVNIKEWMRYINWAMPGFENLVKWRKNMALYNTSDADGNPINSWIVDIDSMPPEQQEYHTSENSVDAYKDSLENYPQILDLTYSDVFKEAKYGLRLVYIMPTQNELENTYEMAKEDIDKIIKNDNDLTLSLTNMMKINYPEGAIMEGRGLLGDLGSLGWEGSQASDKGKQNAGSPHTEGTYEVPRNVHNKSYYVYHNPIERWSLNEWAQGEIAAKAKQRYKFIPVPLISIEIPIEDTFRTDLDITYPEAELLKKLHQTETWKNLFSEQASWLIQQPIQPDDGVANESSPIGGITGTTTGQSPPSGDTIETATDTPGETTTGATATAAAAGLPDSAFPLKKLMTLFAIYNHRHMSDIDLLDETFASTKNSLMQLFDMLLNSDDYTFEAAGQNQPPEQLKEQKALGIPNISFNLMSIITATPITMIRGIADLIDPKWKSGIPPPFGPGPWTPIGWATWAFCKYTNIYPDCKGKDSTDSPLEEPLCAQEEEELTDAILTTFGEDYNDLEPELRAWIDPVDDLQETAGTVAQEYAKKLAFEHGYYHGTGEGDVEAWVAAGCPGHPGGC